MNSFSTYWSYLTWANFLLPKNFNIEIRRKYLLLFSFVLLGHAAFTNPGDTLALKKKHYHSPKKAAIMSAALPGLGQAYNKKYWKIPIIYAGLGGLGYVVKFNNDNYQKFRKAYIYRVDNDSSTIDEYENTYTEGNLNTLQEYYHRNRDLSGIGFAAFYLLNIIDATVDAHLFEFDVNDNLSLSLHPATYMATLNYPPANGITMRLTFK